MSEEDNHKVKTSSSSDDKKKKRRKKRKKRKKLCASHTPQQPVEANSAVKAPEAVQVTPVPRGQTSKRRAASKKSKDPPQEPQLPLASDSDPKEPSVAEAQVPTPSPSPMPTPLDLQVRECLRWEGALQDPRAEEERLEAYRANRRRRYVAQRDAQLVAPLARTPPPLLSHAAL